MSGYVDAEKYKPWRKDFTAGFSSAAIGVVILFVMGVSVPLAVMGGAILLLIGFYFINRGFARMRGKTIESKAIKELDLPKGWIAQPNVRLSSGGDLDLLIVSPDGKRFAIEIKSHMSVTVKRPLFGDEYLSRSNGKKFARDPVAQVMNASALAKAQPFIWFPSAKRDFCAHLKNGVIVVSGGRMSLLKAIGAKSW
jgi:hypothetical protein